MYDLMGSKVKTIPTGGDGGGKRSRDGSATIIGVHWYDGMEGYTDPNAPTLAVAFGNGRVQLMRGSEDAEPVVVESDARAVGQRPARGQRRPVLLALREEAPVAQGARRRHQRAVLGGRRPAHRAGRRRLHLLREHPAGLQVGLLRGRHGRRRVLAARAERHRRRLLGHEDEREGQEARQRPRVAAQRDRRARRVRGSTRVIQRRFNMSVPRARVPENASTLRDRSER
mmetsp:Transcript_3424/g.11880  ORF Transcript_3424/g.11880 Transcript_3424/m.11880 type:complete len:228 (-) Transcript_3424:2-685(-)